MSRGGCIHYLNRPRTAMAWVRRESCRPSHWTEQVRRGGETSGNLWWLCWAALAPLVLALGTEIAWPRRQTRHDYLNRALDLLMMLSDQDQEHGGALVGHADDRFIDHELRPHMEMTTAMRQNLTEFEWPAVRATGFWRLSHPAEFKLTQRITIGSAALAAMTKRRLLFYMKGDRVLNGNHTRKLVRESNSLSSGTGSAENF